MTLVTASAINTPLVCKGNGARLSVTSVTWTERAMASGVAAGRQAGRHRPQPGLRPADRCREEGESCAPPTAEVAGGAVAGGQQY